MSYDDFMEESIFNAYMKKDLVELINLATHHMEASGILGVVKGEFIGNRSDHTTFRIIKKENKLYKEWLEIDEETDEVKRWVVCLV
jgi:hypothetical protein